MLNGGIRKEIQKERFAKEDPKGEHCKSCLLQLKIFAIVKSQDFFQRNRLFLRRPWFGDVYPSTHLLHPNYQNFMIYECQLSCSCHQTTKFPNSKSPIFCLLDWSNSRARHSAIYTLKSRNLFQFFLNLKEASKCVLRIIKKIKTKISL